MSPPAHGPGLFHAVGLFGYEASGIAPHTLGRTWISPVEVTTDPKCVAAFGLQRFGGPWATGTIDPVSASAAVHSVGMFIRYLLDLPLPFEDADARLHTAPEFWVPGLARDAEGGGAHLLAEVGFPVDDHRVGKEVQIELGTPFRIPSRTILPLTWTATGPEKLFPSLDADLEIAPLGRNRTQLSISARYRPPFGAVGRVLDRALLHRVAEATLKDFLDRVGEALGAETGALT